MFSTRADEEYPLEAHDQSHSYYLLLNMSTYLLSSENLLIKL